MFKTLRTLSVALLFAFWLGGCTEEDPKLDLLSEIQATSQLSSVEYVMTKVVAANEKTQLLNRIDINKRFFLAHTEATVKLGVDLSKVTSEDLVIEENKVTLTLPPVEVINFSYPAEKYQIDTVLTSDKLMRKFKPSEFDAYYLMAEREIRRQINKLKLRKTAEDKTRVLLKGLMRNAGFDDIIIQFDTTSAELLVIPPPLEGIEGPQD